MRYLFCLLLANSLLAQQQQDSLRPDARFREDQFYAVVSYALIQDQPKEYAQNGFSTGLGFGFLRDMPFSKSRKWSIASGLGYHYQKISHNLAVGNSNTDFSISNASDFSRNNLQLHYVDIPLEIRWRTATPTNTAFFRWHTGIKWSYLVSHQSVISANGGVQKKQAKGINQQMFAGYFAIGYQSWNLYAQFGLTPLFKKAQLSSGENVTLTPYQLGFIFYIL